MGDTFGGRVGVPITSVLIAILAPRQVLLLLFFFLLFLLLPDILRRLFLILAGGEAVRGVDGDGDDERFLGRLLVVRGRPLFASSLLVL